MIKNILTDKNEEEFVDYILYELKNKLVRLHIELIDYNYVEHYYDIDFKDEIRKNILRNTGSEKFLQSKFSLSNHELLLIMTFIRDTFDNFILNSVCYRLEIPKIRFPIEGTVVESKRKSSFEIETADKRLKDLLNNDKYLKEDLEEFIVDTFSTRSKDFKLKKFLFSETQQDKNYIYLRRFISAKKDGSVDIGIIEMINIYNRITQIIL